MTNERIIKWTLEIANQEKVQPTQLLRDYNIEVLGC